MSQDTEFVDGLLVKPPHAKAPDFVKAAISIRVDELKSWLAKQTTEWVNVDVKVSRGGKWYCAVNTYQKQAAPKRSADDDFPD